jgi:hypothetical protein
VVVAHAIVDGDPFLIQVQTWWAMFALRSVKQWSFATFLIVLLQPVAIFMMAALIVPQISGRTTDLKDDYFREFRWFFSALLLGLAASLAKNVMLTGGLPELRDFAAHLLFIGIAITAMVSRSARVHTILAVLGLALLSGYIGTLFTTLS